MSLLSPGAYLRSKLIQSRYDVRDDSGKRLLDVAAHEASVLISKALVFGKLGIDGDLKYLLAMRPKRVLVDALAKPGTGVSIVAEDNTTTVRDGRGYQFHMRRVMAWAR